MKILLFCPVYHNEPQSLASIWALNDSGHEVSHLYARFQKCDVGSYNILYKYRRAREAALNGGYDAMMIVEDDMIVPPDALSKLAAIDADIAAGLYVNRHKVFNRQPYIAAIGDGETAYFINDKPGFVAENWGQRVPVSSAGLGCVLIRSHVLADIDFRLQVLNNRHILADCDTWFYHDAHESGYHVILDMSLVCGHIADGVVYWPQPDGGIRTTLTTLTRSLLEAA